MSSSFDASLLVAVLTPGAGTHVTKRPQQSWAVSLSAVNACLSTGWQHPPDHGWQGNKAMPGRATRPPAIGGAQKVTGSGRGAGRGVFRLVMLAALVLALQLAATGLRI